MLTAPTADAAVAAAAVPRPCAFLKLQNVCAPRRDRWSRSTPPPNQQFSVYVRSTQETATTAVYRRHVRRTVAAAAAAAAVVVTRFCVCPENLKTLCWASDAWRIAHLINKTEHAEYRHNRSSGGGQLPSGVSKKAAVLRLHCQAQQQSIACSARVKTVVHPGCPGCA